jgi:hypothetical protein
MNEFHPGFIRCTGMAWTGRKHQLIVRCKLPAGHPGSHLENITPPPNEGTPDDQQRPGSPDGGGQLR